MQKFLAYIALFILTICLLGCQDFVAYENHRLGFFVNHPSNWSVLDQGNNDTIISLHSPDKPTRVSVQIEQADEFGLVSPLTYTERMIRVNRDLGRWVNVSDPLEIQLDHYEAIRVSATAIYTTTMPFPGDSRIRTVREDVEVVTLLENNSVAILIVVEPNGLTSEIVRSFRFLSP